MIIALAIFLLCIIGFGIGRIREERHTVEAIISQPQTLAASYMQIAKLEERLFGGTSYHNGLPRDNDRKCECNTICHPETFYIPETPMPKEWADRYGLGKEWEDRYGE